MIATKMATSFGELQSVMSRPNRDSSKINEGKASLGLEAEFLAVLLAQAMPKGGHGLGKGIAGEFARSQMCEHLGRAIGSRSLSHGFGGFLAFNGLPADRRQ